jgi:hypothetical protein
MSHTPKLYRQAIALLEESGLPYEIVNGQKHRKVFVRGELVWVMSHGSHSGRDLAQIKSFIRKATERSC